MNTPPQMPPTLSRLAWPIVGLTAVLAAALVGLYALAPADAKPSLTPLFGLFTSIPAAVAALAAYSQSRRNAVVVEQHGQTIAKIDEQTNGSLDGRIVHAVGKAIDERPGLFTDAAVARGVSTLLERHLDTATGAVPGPAVVQTTITPITPEAGG